MNKTLQEILDDSWPNEIKAQAIRVLIMERMVEALDGGDGELPTVIQRFNKKVAEL